MGGMIRLWSIAITNPLMVFRVLHASLFKAARFNLWTSLLIYVVGYFSIFSLFLGFNASELGGFVFLLAFFLLITLTLVKNYFYTLMISYRRKELINFQDVALLTTLSDIPVFVGFPLLYVLSFWLNGSFIFILFLLFVYLLLRNRSRLFMEVYGISAKFVYMVSLSLWMTIFVILLFFSIYLGVSLQIMISYLLS